jgi:uncharacterized protein (DUF934 family)
VRLLEHGHPVADRWVTVADDAPVPADGPALVGLARLESVGERTAPLGVLVAGATAAEVLAPHLPRLSQVAVQFPKFRDGRGFTLARALRERYRFSGEIRAIGHVLPDQHLFLLRCGFTSVALPEGADEAVWTAALGRYRVAYQPALAEEAPLGRLRRRLATG